MKNPPRIHLITHDGDRTMIACDRAVTLSDATTNPQHVTCLFCLRALDRMRQAKVYRERNVK